MLHEGLPGHPLPLAGGVYDQHPRLLDEWMEILVAKGNHQKMEKRKQERQAKTKGK